MKQADGSGAGILGFGAVACLACCAGPILAFLGGLGVAGLASTLFIGGVGVAVTAAAIAAFVVVRRRGSSCPAADEGPVAVAAPTHRAPQS
jgi:glycerol-3-phosphate acyltransferase PlsY